MQRTKIAIINQVLVSLGCSPVASLDEGTAQSSAVSAIWEMSRDEVLRMHPWNFAVRREALPKLVTTPAFGYTSAYNLPVDCLRVLEVSESDYALENNQVLCNATGSIRLRYIARVEDVTRFDALFTSALAANMGAKLAYPLTQSTSQQGAQEEIYQRRLKEARIVDAQEQPAEEMEESSLITGRF